MCGGEGRKELRGDGETLSHTRHKMAGEAAAAAAGLPGAFPVARSGEARRALRVPVSGAKSGPALWGFRGDGGRRAGLPCGAADERRVMAPGSGAVPAPLPSPGGRGAVLRRGQGEEGSSAPSSGPPLPADGLLFAG